VNDYDDEFERYVDEGVPMTRDLTSDESAWVYLNLK
jgi:hypothetical protein